VRTGFPYWRSIGPTMETQRYRYISSLLVVTCSIEFWNGCAMTRIDYAKPQTFRRPRGPRHSHNTRGCKCSTSSCELQPTSRFAHRSTPAGLPESPWVLSLSAPSPSDGTTGFSGPTLSICRLSQPPDRDTILDGSRVCSTPQALLGLGPSELDS